MNKKILLPFVLAVVAFVRIPHYSPQNAIRQEIIPKTYSAHIIASKPVKTQINAKNSTEYIKSYILSQAKAENVSTTIVSWIVEHESQWGRRMVGDDGKSLGIWMIDRQYHPNISEQCANSMTCSTRVSLEWLKQGKQDIWSTWRLRCTLYPTENPPGCENG